MWNVEGVNDEWVIETSFETFTAAKCTARAPYFYFLSTLPWSSPIEKLQTTNLRLKNPEQLLYSFICFYSFAPRSFGLALTTKNVMKVDSLRSHVAIIVILLLSASCFVKTANEKEVKNTCMKSEKTRNGKKCVGKLYSLTEALGRSAELPVNSQVCRLHWDEIRRQNNRCSCPMA